MCVCVYRSICVYIYRSINPSIHPSIYLSNYLSNYLSILYIHIYPTKNIHSFFVAVIPGLKQMCHCAVGAVQP